MNINVDVNVTLDLSNRFIETLSSVLAGLPRPPADDLDERIVAAVERAVRLADLRVDEPSPNVANPAPQTVEATVSAVQAERKPDEGERWTQERREILDFYYSAGDALIDILPRLNACPGPKVTQSQMQATIVGRKLKRTATFSPPEQASATSDAEIIADDTTIRHWAGPRGLCVSTAPIDLPRINRKRVELGLAPFSVKKGAGR